MKEKYQVRRAEWDEDRDMLLSIRREVFVLEQQVPEELEADGADADASHVLALGPRGEHVGTARLLADGRIGRVAVLHDYRGRGIGTDLVKFLIGMAREQGLSRCSLHAQSHSILFYERLGFTAFGPEFLEAGIPHREMECTF